MQSGWGWGWGLGPARVGETRGARVSLSTIDSGVFCVLGAGGNLIKREIMAQQEGSANK